MGPNSLRVKQFRTEGCFSYFVVDADARQVVAIDPRVRAMDEYRDWLGSEGFRVVATLDTQLHSDHLSASHLMAERFGAEIAMSEATASARPTRRLRSGETAAWGAIRIEAWATPGHTSDSMSFRVDAGGFAGVFTGDALWIGAEAPPEGEGAGAELARASREDVLFRLPEPTLVFPGHDVGDILFSSIGVEKGAARPAASAGWLRAPDEDVAARLHYNLAATPPPTEDHRFGGAPIPGLRGLAVTTPAKAAPRLREGGFRLIDVREAGEFARGHVPGALNWPQSELSAFVGTLRPDAALFVYCEQGRRSAAVARTLDRLGFRQVVLVQGGYQAWRQAGI